MYLRTRPITPQFQLSDLLTMYFVRTVGKAQGARGGADGGEREAVADAALHMHLDRPIDDLTGHGGRGDLDHRNLLLGGAVSHGVHHIGRIEHQPARLIDEDARFGDALERNALFRHAPAEGDALLCPPAHHFQGPFGHADQAHAMVDAAGTEAVLRNFEAAALAEQNILRRYAYIDEIDLRMAVGRMIVAEHGQLAQPLDARRVHRHEDHRLLAVKRRSRVGLAHEYQDFAAWISGAGRPPLAAVDHVVIAVAHDGGLDIRGIARRHVGLGHGEGRADPPLEHG